MVPKTLFMARRKPDLFSAMYEEDLQHELSPYNCVKLVLVGKRDEPFQESLS